MAEQNIEVLSDLDHIRKRPGMYIGSTETPIQLLVEVIDNAIDELINNYANKVIILESGNTFLIADNGRSIPNKDIEFENKKINSIIAIATKLFSSGKFTTPDIHIGMHGVGLTAVNALSEYLYIFVKTKKSNTGYLYSFINGNFNNKLEFDFSKEDSLKEFGKYLHDNNIFKFTKEKASIFKNIEVPSTLVIFKPNKKYFDSLNYDINSIELKLKSVLMLKKEFMNSDNNEEIYFLNKKITVKPLEEYFKEEFEIKDPNIPIFKIKYENGKTKLVTLFTYDLSENASINNKSIGFVNYKLADGVHVNKFNSLIADEFPDKELKGEYAKYKLRTLVALLIPDPIFDSQTKSRLSSKKQVDPLFDNNTFVNKLKQIFKDNEEFFVGNVIPQIKQYILSKKLKVKDSNSKKLKLTSGNPVRLGTIKKYLYIVEGESAGGTILQCKRNDESILPLTGKVINAETANLDRLANNKEVKYLTELLSNSEWEKIICIADADPDGHHITVLVSLLINKLFPNIITSGKYNILLPPLYAVKTKEKNYYYYELNEIDENLKKYGITRFKGLGEMTPEQMREIIDNKSFYYEIREMPEDLIKVLTLMKKQLLQEEAV